jgi:hypothetical protein
MRRPSIDHPHPFPFCADCVPFELVARVALLGNEELRERGSNSVFQIFTNII